MTAYVEWVLGVSRSAAAPFVVTEIDPDTGAHVRAQPLAQRVRRARGLCRPRRAPDRVDRRPDGVPGRNGTLDHPAALERGEPLSGKVGAGLDPCGALQTTVELRAGRPCRDRLFPRRGGDDGRGAGVDHALPRRPISM